MLGATRRVRSVARWRQHLPALLVTAALPLVALIAQASAGEAVPIALAGHARAVDDHCLSLDPSSAGRAAVRSPQAPGALNLVEELSGSGELAGRRLALSITNGRSDSFELPVESSVADVVGSLLVYTEAPANAPSEVHGLDLETGCDTRLAVSADVVRSAVIDGTGDAIYAHSVSRAGRDDLGVTRIDLDSGSANRVVPPLPPSPDFGPTFGTALHWSEDGDALVVQSCGFSSCRSRVLDIASGHVSMYDHSGQGELIGLTASHLLTYADCAGLPCDVLSTDLRTGAVRSLAADVSSATLARDSGGQELLRVDTPHGIEEVEQ